MCLLSSCHLLCLLSSCHQMCLLSSCHQMCLHSSLSLLCLHASCHPLCLLSSCHPLCLLFSLSLLCLHSSPSLLCLHSSPSAVPPVQPQSAVPPLQLPSAVPPLQLPSTVPALQPQSAVPPFQPPSAVPPFQSTPPVCSQQVAVDRHNIPGMDSVDELAEYLVELRTETGLTLTNQQASTVVGLWENLEQFDKDRVVYAARHQDRLLTGRFRSPKKKAVFTPGVESTKRCVLGSSGLPAQWPDCCHLVETIFVRLCNIHTSPPKMGQHSMSRWSLILQDYKKIRQLILCNGVIMQQTTLQLVEVNQTTLIQWHNQRLKDAHLPHATQHSWAGKNQVSADQAFSYLYRAISPPPSVTFHLDPTINAFTAAS
eukprot:superscaffoldBa00007576_g22659